MRNALLPARLLALAACALLALGMPSPTRAQSDAATYRYRALRTQSYTYARLAFPAGPERCPTGKLLSFRRAVGSEQSDAWHVASQLMADVALARIGGPG